MWFVLFFVLPPTHVAADDVDEDLLIEFNVPEQRVDLALTQFAEQAGITLLFPSDAVGDVMASRLVGEYSASEGAEILLAGTYLIPTFKNMLVLNILLDPDSNNGETVVKKPKSILAKIGTVLAGTLLGSNAIAQESGGTGAQNEGVIEEIVVTAQKRQQTLLDVGISVSVADSDSIRDRRMAMVTDITLFTPNATVKETIPGLMPIISIRGVGLNDFNAANNPAAGVYIDEVALSSLALISSDLFDLEQMEVLKGPQGTLYGRNSTAGALNIVTAKPDLAGFEARLSAGLGDHDTYEVDGMVNTSLSDSTAMRLSFKRIDQAEGYWENRFTGSDVGQRDITMARAQLLWEASDKANVLFKLEEIRGRSELGHQEFVGAIPTAISADCPGSPGCANFLGYADIDTDPYTGDWSTDPNYDLNQTIATLKVELDFDFARLTSITGHIDFDRSYASDVDASPMKILDFLNTDDVQQFSQEFRLSGEQGNIFWQTGVFYAKDEIQTTYAGELQALLNTTTFTFADLEATSTAVFGNVEWSVGENLTLIAGLRASEEEKSIVASTADLATEPPASALSSTPVGLGPVTLASVDDTIEDTSVDWKVGLNWTPNDVSIVYLSASRGTKSGGFFTGVATTDQQLLPYDKETLTAYEIGVKGRMADLGFSYEASLFYYDYDDIQTFSSDISGAVPLNRLSNVDGASITGLDLQARWNSQALEGLSVIAGLGYLDTEIDAFASAGVVIPKGNEMPEAPELSGNLAVQYGFNITDTVSAQIAVDGYYQSEVFHGATNEPFSSSDSYSVANARLQFYFPGDLELSIWAKNLSDEEYTTSVSNNLPLGNGFLVYGPPRTYGVSVTKFFQ